MPAKSNIHESSPLFIVAVASRSVSAAAAAKDAANALSPRSAVRGPSTMNSCDPTFTTSPALSWIDSTRTSLTFVPLREPRSLSSRRPAASASMQQ
jgi:hypothetical protein